MRWITKPVRIALVGISALCWVSISQAGTYTVNGNRDTDTVSFASTAKLEFIEGKNHDISGYFTFPPESSADSIIGILKVDLRTLKTGIDTRDEHMRERHLHTDKYPYAYFELRTIRNMPQAVEPGTEYTVDGDGYFYIHGNKRSLSATIQFIVKDNKQLQVTAEFSLNLDDYKIPRPKALFLKLAETINVRVTCTAQEGSLTEAVNLPDYKLLK